MMDLSIIIVNWNTSELLVQCIESIYRGKPRPTFEIIVVDNGSSDDSVSLLTKHFPNIHLIKNGSNLGFAKANNQGLAVAKGRYFLLLNSDTIVLPNALDKMVQTAEDHADVGAIGPKLLNMDGTLQESWSGFPTFWSELFGRLIHRRNPLTDVPFAYEVDWIMGACLLVRSETIAEVGGLDEGYSFYSEEVDWCFRMKEQGWKILYLSNAEVYHIGGGSSERNSLIRMGLLYKNKLRYFNKYYGSTQATFLRYGLALAYFFGLIPRILLIKRSYGGGYWNQILLRVKLIWCLLRNQFPEILT